MKINKKKERNFLTNFFSRIFTQQQQQSGQDSFLYKPFVDFWFRYLICLFFVFENPIFYFGSKEKIPVFWINLQNNNNIIIIINYEEQKQKQKTFPEFLSSFFILI